MSSTARSTEPAATGLGLVHELGRSLRVTHDDIELARYVYQPWDPQLESPKPYLHPLRTLGGDQVSLYRPHDHVWHKGIAWSLPNVGTENFWGGPTFLRGRGYAQLDNNGSMVHAGFEALDADSDKVRVRQRLRWDTEGGDTWFEEERDLAFAVAADDRAWTLGFGTRMRNVSGHDVVIGSPTTEGRPDAGYGGLFWRGPRSFSGGTVRTPDRTGGDELMGSRAPWMAYTGRHDDHARSSTLVFVDDPRREQPTQWFVRTGIYACLCPAPFFDTEHTVAPGETVDLSYAVVVADGDADDDRASALAELGRRSQPTAAGASAR